MARSSEAGPSPEAVGGAAVVESLPPPAVEISIEEPEIRPSDFIADEDKREEAQQITNERIENNQERADDEALDRLKTLERVLESGAGTPQEVIEVVNAHSFQDILKREKERKNGTGFSGKVRNWLRGDSDYVFDKDGKLQHKALADISRRAVTSVFNRRTMASAAAVGALGLLTGGVGWVSGMTVGGGIFGRFTAEMVDYFKGDQVIRGGTGGARKEIMLAERERWYKLQQLSADYERTRDSDPIEANSILAQIVDIYHRQGEAAVTARVSEGQKSLDQKQATLQKWRGLAQTGGEIGGMAAGLGMSFLTGNFGPLNLDFWKQVNGQSAFHNVVNHHGAYHFLWSQADKAAGLSHGAVSHLLATNAAGQAFNAGWVPAMSIMQQGLPVMAASILAGLTYKGSEKLQGNYREQEKTRQKTQYSNVAEQIPTTQHYLRELADKLGIKGLPENPINYPINWEKQGQLLPKSFDTNKLPQWIEKDANGQPAVNQATGEWLTVGIVAVDPDHNRIAVTGKVTHDATGAKVWPVRTMRLDDFLYNHLEIVKEKAGQPAWPNNTEPDRKIGFRNDSNPTTNESSTNSGPRPENPDFSGVDPEPAPDEPSQEIVERRAARETFMDQFTHLQTLQEEDPGLFERAKVRVGTVVDEEGTIYQLRSERPTGGRILMEVPDQPADEDNPLAVRVTKWTGTTGDFKNVSFPGLARTKELCAEVIDQLNAADQQPEKKVAENNAPAIAELRPHDKLLLSGEGLDDRQKTLFDRIAKNMNAEGATEVEVEINSVDTSRQNLQLKIGTRPVPIAYSLLAKMVKEHHPNVRDSFRIGSVQAAENPPAEPTIEATENIEAPTPAVEIPKSEEIVEGWKRFGINDVTELKGRKLKLRDPIDFLHSTAAALEGQLATDELSTDSEFTVEDAASDLLTIRLNGARLTVEARELETQVAAVI